jgi:Asp-tRNA(Asn)/Glu-tRNA(Gln) amidotransferase B subunit
LGLGCLSIGLIGAFGWFFLESNFKTHRLTLVAGSKDGESYILSKALERVVEAKNPQIQIDVVETKGTEENIEKLEKGEAQLATAQADIHISNIIGLMKSVQEKQISAKVGLEELDKVFAQAATDLIEEKISQESFRTLSEAYKATRDVIAHQTDTPNEKSDRIPKIRA